MATYECSNCGMSVNATCGKCDAPLVDDVKLDNGSEVQYPSAQMITVKLNLQPVVEMICPVQQITNFY